jgi:hypothetical protein
VAGAGDSGLGRALEKGDDAADALDEEDGEAPTKWNDSDFLEGESGLIKES